MSSISSLTGSTNRITGLVSGLDTETLVEQLMAAERIPLEKLQQKKQLAEWKMDAYREITSALRIFNDKYFDYLNPSTNMLSQSTYIKYSAASSDTSVVGVTASSSAEAGTHTMIVNKLATAAVYKSASSVTKAITAAAAADFDAAAGKSFTLNVDGTATTITMDESITDMGSLQAAIDKAIGSGKVKVADTNGDGTGYLVIGTVENSGVSSITLSDGTDGALSSLGFSSDVSLTNRLSTSDTLETISQKMKNAITFDDNGKISFEINGTGFEFDKTTTLSTMLNKINSSGAGVTMKYNSNSDTFTITAKETGAGDKIKFGESAGTFLASAGITSYTAGEDAEVILDGEKLTRSSNSITQDGVTYRLLKESSEEQTITVSMDTDAIYDQITAFVKDYNELIDTISNKLSEDYDRDYPPLTDAEKEEMSEDEIALWEKKAKTGLLENDATLEKLLYSMRTALYESVSGVGSSLTAIGITTSSNYEEGGKLEINADQLRKAIENDPEGVMNLFSKPSETYSGTTNVRTLSSSERSVRTREEGLAYRLYDLIQDNISTLRDNNGNKGILLVKAGTTGDASQYSNQLYDQITDYEEDIEAMLEKLEDKEDYYYKKFSAMETYINNMNSQITALQSYLGS